MVGVVGCVVECFGLFYVCCVLLELVLLVGVFCLGVFLVLL